LAAGYHVSAITPKSAGDPDYEILGGVHLYKYRPPPKADGYLAYAWEFLYCWLQTGRLALQVWRRMPFAMVQACNPPDTFWALALLFRHRGVKFLYDQHDLCPEVYQSRFSKPSSRIIRLLLALERATYRTAHHVVVTNDSYRKVALDRGRKAQDDVTVVRTGPDSERLRPVEPKLELRREHDYLACYVGVMGPQDGVDVLLLAIDHYVHVLGQKNCNFALLGYGDSWADLRNMVAALKLEEHVVMPGWADDSMLTGYLSTADVGLSPDPPNALNELSTMNKTMEYMAFGLPVLAFDLAETRVSADNAAVYVPTRGVDPTTLPGAFAEALVDLLSAPDRRLEMGQRGRQRVEHRLDWRHQEAAYLAVYSKLLGNR
jgi:glycosyltransferase involved in cell wall biosynthesis